MKLVKMAKKAFARHYQEGGNFCIKKILLQRMSCFMACIDVSSDFASTVQFYGCAQIFEKISEIPRIGKEREEKVEEVFLPQLKKRGF